MQGRRRSVRDSSAGNLDLDFNIDTALNLCLRLDLCLGVDLDALGGVINGRRGAGMRSRSISGMEGYYRHWIETPSILAPVV